MACQGPPRGLTGAHMRDNALDGPVLSARIAAFEDDQHSMSVLYDVLLHLDELYLQGSKQVGVLITIAATFLRALRHWLAKFLIRLCWTSGNGRNLH